MKTEDLRTLKMLLNGTDYEVLNESPDDNDKFFVVKKKDPWEGVEFAECITDFSAYTEPTMGKIYKIIKKDMHILFLNGFYSGIHICSFKPSTESAYVEQLKEESFKRFGEIKEGDRFERSWYKDGLITAVFISKDPFSYRKFDDTLSFSGFEIYQQGKWAKKIESFKAAYIDWDYYNSEMEVRLAFKITNWDKAKDKDDIGEYLAKKIRKLLKQQTK